MYNSRLDNILSFESEEDSTNSDSNRTMSSGSTSSGGGAGEGGRGRIRGGGAEEQPYQRPSETITLARWSTRFWAWIVDFIIVIVATEIIFAIAYAPLAFSQGLQENPALGAVKYAVQSMLFFGYWIYFESTTGQSTGKKLLKIKTTDLSGNLASSKSVAIQSFGKAFLLPIDVFFGWIFTNEKRQRLFNRASDTIVIKTATTTTITKT